MQHQKSGLFSAAYTFFCLPLFFKLTAEQITEAKKSAISSLAVLNNMADKGERVIGLLLLNFGQFIK